MKPAHAIPLHIIALFATSIIAACSGGGGATPTGTTTASTTTTTTSTGPLALGPFAQPTIGAPLAASLGGNTPLLASGATPNFANPTVGTVFPLNQSALESDPGVNVFGITYPNGVTLTFLGNQQINGMTVGTYEFKGSNTDVTLTTDGTGVTIPNSNNTKIALIASNLNYTLLASWIIPSVNTNVADAGVGVSGYQTPASGVPVSGTATYLATGGASGNVVVPAGVGAVKGDVTVNANFATGAVTGSLTNMNVGTGAAATPWNNVSLSGSLSGATISGTTAAATSPSGGFSFGASATGTFNGALYGPNGQELGAVWSLHDSTGGGKSALGLIGATKQ
jgi:hypothetical protein